VKLKKIACNCYELQLSGMHILFSDGLACAAWVQCHGIWITEDNLPVSLTYRKDRHIKLWWATLNRAELLDEDEWESRRICPQSDLNELLEG